MKVRIQFIKAGEVIKHFDREAKNKADAVTLADQIAKDSGIAHDSRSILPERKFKAVLTKAGKYVDLLESKAYDETTAREVIAIWAAAAKVSYDGAHVAFLEGK